MEFPLAPPTQPGKILPLSLSQREVWLDQMAWPGSSHLNIGGGGFLIGSLDLGKFRAALTTLVEETEALRLVPLADGHQFLLSRYTPDLVELDFRQEEEPRQAMVAWWQQKIKEPFPSDGRPPWRFILLKGSDELHGLTIQFHHLIMDGWGTTQVMRRWSDLYNNLMQPEASKLEKSPDYLQFIEESNAYRDSPAFIKDGQYWTAHLPEVPPPLIELRHSHPQDGLPPARVFHQGIPRSDYVTLGEFAKGRGYTPFSIVLAAVAIYYARTRNCRQVTIGIPTLNRSGNRYIATPGMFVGVMPITIEVNPEATVESVVSSAHRALREALRHSRYPLSELSRSLHILRNKRSGSFDILLSFERQNYTITFGTARSADSKQFFSGIARYPLGITLCEFTSEQSEQDLEMILEGSSACFANQEVELLARRLWHLVLRIMADPERSAGEIDILPPEERWALLEGLHQNLARNEGSRSFISLFEHQAQLRPNAIALTWQGGSMSYGELERRSRALARGLSKYIHGNDTIIAMALEREPEMIVALLAISRAGAAFLPLDPDAPLTRLRNILAGSGAAIMLIQARNRDRLATLHEHTLEVDSTPGYPDTPEAKPLVGPRPEDLAYVLYTSGSTGEPKGVMIEHSALSIRLAWLSRNYRVTCSDRSAQATQYTFDPALIEICLPLIHGASVALPPPGRLSARALADFVVAQGVTIMAFVPSTLERFLDALGDPPPPDLKLRVACSGGEILSAELANRFLRLTGGQLYNVYGPTETVIFSTAWPCQATSVEKPLPIGRCIDNTRIYILDANLYPLPFGERGEICIGGDAVARGYLKHPELDRQAFFEDPFVPGARLYRTGDTGWLDDDGNLYFSGRRDRQIKLRGYRIEPGEIESALLAMEGIFRAAVKTIASDKQQALHAWVVASQHIGTDALQAYLRMLLPDYMLPAGFSLLTAMPETTTGKIDYAALPSPEIRKPVTHSRAPAAGLESDLAELWSHALGKPVYSATENFFELGGDSLGVIDIIAGIEKLLGRKIPLYLVTEHPTIESLARALENRPQKIQSLLRLGGDPGYPPLFLVASGHGDLIRFQALATALAQSFDIFMLQPPDDDPTNTLVDLASIYADRVRKHGISPVHLAGFSVGGVTALETSRMLRDQGMNVSALILIDTLYPNALLRARRLWQFLGWLTKRLHLHELSMNGRRLGALFGDTGLVIQIKALWEYEPTEYPGSAVLIKSSGLVFWQRWLFKPWRRLMAGGLTEVEAPGLHGSMFEQGNIGSLAVVLNGLKNAPGQDQINGV